MKKDLKGTLINHKHGIAKMRGIDIIEAGKWFGQLKKEFEAAGDVKTADLFNMLRGEMVYIITFLAKKGAEVEIDNYTLPMHNIKALGFDSSRFVEEIEEAQILEETTKSLGPIERVEVLRTNPALRSKMVAYESRRDAYAKDNKLTEFELLFSTKEFEKVRLGTKGIKEHIEYYLRNGKRKELIPYLMDTVFVHKGNDFDFNEAHNFINRFKEIYDIPEPGVKIKLDVEKDDEGNYKLPSDVWMRVYHSTEEEPTEYLDTYMLRRHGVKAKLLFTTDMKSVLIHRIKKWRKATVEEVRTEIMQKCLFGSAAYKFTVDTYGRKFMALDKHKNS